MRRLIVFSVVVCVGLACGPVFGLGADHPKGKPVSVDGWPEGLAKLVNGENRVHGFFVNANDFFFLTGDTEVLNEFLAGCAALKQTPVSVVLHPGVAFARSPWKPAKDAKPIRCQWRIDVMRRGGHPKAPIREGAPKDRPGCVLLIHAWLDGNVELDELSVPEQFEVESGGEIEKFVAEHATHRQTTRRRKSQPVE